MKQDTGDLILLLPSFIQSAQELPWQLVSAASACVRWRGLEEPRGENDVSSERMKSPQFSQVCGISPRRAGPSLVIVDCRLFSAQMNGNRRFFLPLSTALVLVAVNVGDVERVTSCPPQLRCRGLLRTSPET